MSEETKPKRKRSHELRDYIVTLDDGTPITIQSDDLRNARKKAIETYGAAAINSVDYATGSRRNSAWDANDTTSTKRSLDFHNRRRAKLDKLAIDNGWKSWYDYESAALKGVVDISTGS